MLKIQLEGQSSLRVLRKEPRELQHLWGTENARTNFHDNLLVSEVVFRRRITSYGSIWLPCDQFGKVHLLREADHQNTPLVERLDRCHRELGQDSFSVAIAAHLLVKILLPFLP
jgi:hypothetical protein